MLRGSLLQPVNSITAFAIAVSVMGATIDCAAAAKRRYAAPPAIIENTLTGPPIMAIVAIKDQRISLYDADGGALRARVSSGQTGYETPVGIYSILQKNKEHYSNLYDDAAMPFMQRLTWSGIALHAGALPGYPASHGCVRLPYSYAQDIFPRTKVGMRVVVARDNIAPIEIAHSLLPKPARADDSAVVSKTAYQSQDSDFENPFHPELSNWPARQAQLEGLKSVAVEKLTSAEATKAPAEQANRDLAIQTKARAKAGKILRTAEAIKRSADDKVAQAERALAGAAPKQIQRREAEKAKAIAAAAAAEAKRTEATQQLHLADDDFVRVAEIAKAANAAKNEAMNAAKEAERKTFPISMFVSRKTQTLYVRQGHEAVFDIPVEIAEPDRPIGTYVYTAVDYNKQGDDLTWTAVSLNRSESADYAGLSNDTAPPKTDAASAASALDRVTLPPDVAQRIAGLAWPGSSLIISDEPDSKETGKGTDFVVIMSGEPQGGIKSRPRSPAPSRYRYGYDDGYYVYDSYNRPRRMRPQSPKSFFWW